MKRVKAVIMAGGKGTRFRPYTEIIAKPMIPLGPKQKPILEHIIHWLSKNGIKEFVFLIGYLGQQIKNYFGKGERWNIQIQYSEDTKEYHDTGGALLNAYRKGLLDTETILTWYGDILANVNVRKLLSKHWSNKADATLVLAEKYQLPVGVAEIGDEGRIVKLVEKPWYPLKVTIGILALQTRVLDKAEEALGKNFDIMSHLIPWMIENEYNVLAYVHDGFWYDVGSMERYAKLDGAKVEEILEEVFGEEDLARLFGGSE